MSWRSDEQRGEVARALLALVRLDRMWTPEGPTDEAVELVEAGGGYLSGGEALMLRVAFDAWNGEGGASLGDVLGRLDNRRLEAVGSLVVALARGEVDDWIERWGAEA